jgi:hypothetical protein
MGNHKNRRQQTAKSLTSGRNPKFNEAMRELGRSNAARPHKSDKDYRRKPKHSGRGWE